MRRRARAALAALGLALWIGPVLAAATGTLSGTTTTQQTVRLAGVEVTVIDAANGRQAAVVVSDGTGAFRVPGLRAGRYNIVARLAGFNPLAPGPFALSEGESLHVTLDLVLAPIELTVDVAGDGGALPSRTAVSQDTIRGRMIDILPVEPDSFQSVLPTLPGVVRAADGRISLKGGRPTQGGLQVGHGYANDPSTGNFGVELPTDAVESVQAVPNPYGAEDGRFSSSVVRVETRSGGDRWRASANRIFPVPCLKLCDGVNVGFRHYEPRGWFGGPLIKDRLFLSQGIEYKFTRVRIPSLPEDANDTVTRIFDVFTRIDAVLGPAHQFVATAAFFPRRSQFVNLNTFNPVDVTPDLELRGYSVAASETATLSPAALLESSFAASRYDVNVFGHSHANMVLTTEGNRGSFFNTHDRHTQVFQWSESFTTFHRGPRGEHQLKLGLDVMHASYTGSSQSRPVIVVRADGTVSRRIEFGDTTAQQASGTDLAAFAQDRWLVARHLTLEPGIRVDRDGVLRRTNVSPRIGLVMPLLADDVSVLRGGAGLFYERTPLNVGAFESYEPATVTRFAADGLTPLGPPVRFAHRASSLETPRSLVWNVEYDQRIGASVFLKVNHLQRRGSAAAIVDPVESVTGGGLRLDSRGQSRYEETEVSVRWGSSNRRQLTASYVRSHSMADLNVFDLFYGNVRDPIVRPNEYSLTPTDVPHRLIVTAAVTLWKKWTMSPLVEIRSGFPYSVVNQDQAFVGAANTGGRFPVLQTVDVNILRAATILGFPVTVGFRGSHLLNTFSPRDVQANLDAPAFRTFYNSFPRRVAFTFQFMPR